jgi:hypothetical protein
MQPLESSEAFSRFYEDTHQNIFRYVMVPVEELKPWQKISLPKLTFAHGKTAGIFLAHPRLLLAGC